ncbi:O-antigen flippase Wzx [Fulvivirga imtechensis AK7]|uniref:O-antigen flippase Wzx n=1 Tax=Fulvivirga imtechensis AK7 TaxID=1237149 RepID=L8JSV0_9BACT|nr:oligosaccharide flippase family protein [Fulvivirga imtechensis]ELR71253.1 O-antigen flippase Wzx [Fulvivirga imtechensis AK7]
MSAGAGLGVVLQIVFTPVLSRIYSPEVYGHFAVYNLLLDHFVMFVGLALTDALLVPKKMQDFYALAKTIIYSTLIGLVLFIAVLALFKDRIFGQFFNITNVSWYLFLIPGGILYALHQIFSAWNIRFKKFSKNARAIFLSNFISRLFALVFGLFNPSALAFVGSAVSGQLFSLPFLAGSKMLKVIFGNFKRLSLKSLGQVLVDYKQYPLYIFPGNFMNRFSHSIPIWVLGLYFSPSKIGVYFFAVNLLNLPLNVIGNALRPVFLQKAFELRNNRKRLQQMTKEVFYRLFFIGIPFLLILIIFGDLLFQVIFGDDWIESGLIASILATGFFFQLISSPLSGLRRVLNKEREEFILQIFFVVIRSTMFIYAFFDSNFIHLVIFYGIINTLIYIVNTVDNFRLVGASLLKISLIILITIVFISSILAFKFQ